MKGTMFIFVVLVCLIVSTQCKHWALVVAGSSEWYNYRHQADVCHAYQILHANGIPDEQIVVMMFDDIAHNIENPTPGIIINHPNGSDVYHGVPKDYTRRDVTPTNFLNILKGNRDGVVGGSGKVIDSGPDDYIFVNMVDHGAPGIFAFPDMMELHARDLISTIHEMYEAKKYKQMVLYVEACESGSLFAHLLDKNVKVYATTAANGKESSYACYYYKRFNTFLGDLYSVNWMEDSDREDLTAETLQKQFEIVRQETNRSHVQEFGDMTISDLPVDTFEGNGDAHTLRYKANPIPKVPKNPVASEEVAWYILTHSGNKRQLKTLEKQHSTIKCQMRKIVHMSSTSNKYIGAYLQDRRALTQFDCYEPVAKKYLKTCQRSTVGMDGYHFRQMYALVNMCEDNVPRDTIIAAIDQVCNSNSQSYCV